jgi:hypothetical protein
VVVLGAARLNLTAERPASVIACMPENRWVFATDSALHRVSLPPDVERMFKNAESFLERATIDGWLIQSRRPSRHLSSAWADDPHEKHSETSFAAQ